MEYQNDDIFFQLGQVLGATVDTTTVRAHIVQLMANKNFYVRQNDTLRDDIKTLEGVQSVLSAENRRLKIQVEQLQQTNRQIETMRAKAQRDFEMVADYADRLNTQIGSHSNEINSMQKKLEKAEEDNENYKDWFGVNSPTIIYPITPPRYSKTKTSRMTPNTPQKRSAAWQVRVGGGKTKSIDALVEKELARANARSYSELHPVDFEEFENASNSDPFSDPFYDISAHANESRLFAGTPTKTKKSAAKTARPKKIVPKKQVGRKSAPKKAIGKPAPETYMDSEEQEVLIVTNRKPLSSWSAATHAQARAEYEDEEAQTDYMEESSDTESEHVQEKDTTERSWEVNCICGSDHDVEDWIACTLCECYDYDVKAASADDFVHLCPDCDLRDSREQRTSDGNKRKCPSSEDDENDDDTGGKGKKARHNAWTQHEKTKLVQAMKAHLQAVEEGQREEIYDAKLFALISQDCAELGVARNANAIKNMWNRELRAVTGLDERRHKNASKLATSLQ